MAIKGAFGKAADALFFNEGLATSNDLTLDEKEPEALSDVGSK